MNTREKIGAGALLSLIGVILMIFPSQSISTVGGIAIGIGVALFLTNLKE